MPNHVAPFGLVTHGTLDTASSLRRHSRMRITVSSIAFGLLLVAAAPARSQTVNEGVASVSTDHQQVVRRWGVEARRLRAFDRTLGQDPECTAAGRCTVDVNALGVRRWVSERYAWNAGLAFALGGGSSRTAAGPSGSWDTYLGLGPTLGATFLLADWKHLAVGAGPQLDFVFFMPGGSRPKNLVLDLRGVVEGELHFGFWGLPQLSVSANAGLQVHYRKVTGTKAGTTATTSEWSVGFLGERTPWSLITNLALRYYF